MREKRGDSFDLRSTYAFFDGPGEMGTVEASASFWPDLMAGRIRPGDRLVTAMEVGDPTHWEMHPNGDELLVVLAGAAEAVLEEEERERIVPMKAGEAFIVPKGRWHQVRPKTRGCRILFATAGEGTEHRN